jgi:hypothetical protein
MRLSAADGISYARIYAYDYENPWKGTEVWIQPTSFNVRRSLSQDTLTAEFNNLPFNGDKSYVIMQGYDDVLRRKPLSEFTVARPANEIMYGTGSGLSSNQYLYRTGTGLRAQSAVSTERYVQLNGTDGRIDAMGNGAGYSFLSNGIIETTRPSMTISNDIYTIRGRGNKTNGATTIQSANTSNAAGASSQFLISVNRDANSATESWYKQHTINHPTLPTWAEFGTWVGGINGAAGLLLNVPQVRLSSLAGIGTRNVVADELGNLMPGEATTGGGTADGNNFPSSLAYNSGTGVLTLGRTGLSDLTATILPAVNNIDSNFATANLTATGNRSHNFSGYNLAVNNIANYSEYITGDYESVTDGDRFDTAYGTYTIYAGNEFRVDYNDLYNIALTSNQLEAIFPTMRFTTVTYEGEENEAGLWLGGGISVPAHILYKNQPNSDGGQNGGIIARHHNEVTDSIEVFMGVSQFDMMNAAEMTALSYVRTRLNRIDIRQAAGNIYINSPLSAAPGTAAVLSIGTDGKLYKGGTPSGGGSSYTNEEALDYVGGAMNTTFFTHDDAANTITLNDLPQSKITGLSGALTAKQDVLVSGTNIKTINGTSLLGSGDIVAGSPNIAPNLQTGTTYAPVLTDDDRTVELSNAANVTVTIPTNATTAFEIGTRISFVQGAAGQVVLSPAGGVTLLSADNAYRTRTQYSAITIEKKAADTWYVSGDAVVL